MSQSDVARRMPPLAGNLWMGDKAQPLLDPLASRSTPLSPTSKLLFATAAAITVFGVVWWLQQERRE